MPIVVTIRKQTATVVSVGPCKVTSRVVGSRVSVAVVSCPMER